MSRESRRLAGILLVVFPTVVFGGVSLLQAVTQSQHGYVDDPLRHDLWRAGHAHAGVLLVLSLVVLRYVDEARFAGAQVAGASHNARCGDPAAGRLFPLGDLARGDATERAHQPRFRRRRHPGAGVAGRGNRHVADARQRRVNRLHQRSPAPVMMHVLRTQPRLRRSPIRRRARHREESSRERPARHRLVGWQPADPAPAASTENRRPLQNLKEPWITCGPRRGARPHCFTREPTQFGRGYAARTMRNNLISLRKIGGGGGNRTRPFCPALPHLVQTRGRKPPRLLGTCRAGGRSEQAGPGGRCKECKERLRPAARQQLPRTRPVGSPREPTIRGSTARREGRISRPWTSLSRGTSSARTNRPGR
jgi:hypothetical protein